MNPSSPFILRPVMTTLAMTAIFILGWIGFFSLPVSDMPSVDYPVITVMASFPGASPDTMANSVASPLEQQFMAIQGVNSVTSNNVLGTSTIVLQFDLDKDINVAAQDVNSAIQNAQSNLPDNLPQMPSFKKVNPADAPILYIALTSDTQTLGDLYMYANAYIGQRLTMVSGVAEVIVYGTAYAARIRTDPGKLASLGITLSDVADAMSEGNPFLPTGQLDGKEISSNIVVDGQLNTAEAYDPLFVTYRDNAPIRIQDLGKTVDSVQNFRIWTRYITQTEDLPTVVLAVQRQPGTNTVAIVEDIREILPRLTEAIPSSVNVEVFYDRSTSIKESVKEVEFTLIVAFILVVLVIFIYLGKLVETVIPSIVMPMSIIATFLAMYYFGFNLDVLSMLALTLAIGFIVDDAIVVLENITRRVESGESPKDAAINGSKQIGFTIIAMTVSLVAVFIPMLFMPGLLGRIFREFSVTLVTVTVMSGIIALTLSPMLCSLFVQPKKEKEKASRVEAFSEWFNQKLLSWYEPGLKWALKHPKFLLLCAAGSVVASYFLLTTLPADFLPPDDVGFMITFTQGEEGTSSERMQGYMEEFNEVVKENPAVKQFVSVAAYPEYRQGVGFIRLTDKDERKSIFVVAQELYKALWKIPGLQTFIKIIPLIDLSVGSQTKGSYQYALQSTDSKALYASGKDLYDKMVADDTFQSVSSDMEQDSPQVTVEILRDKASTLGITAEAIENALLLAFSGNRVTRIQSPINQYDVIVELELPFQWTDQSLNEIYVRSAVTGQLVPLSAVTEWKQEIGASSINHISHFPSVTISYNLSPGIPLSVGLERLSQLTKESIQEGVTGMSIGATQSFEESMQGAALLLIATVVAIYIFLGMLYESFIHPLTILSTLPPAIAGGLFTLLIFGETLSLYSFLGLILLIGIVKKNAIMVVDFALENIREKGESAEKSIYDACLERFRPIMMTTVAAIAGAVPIAFAMGGGSEARAPLGMVIIGGLAFAQLMTLFLTPVIYLYLERLSEYLNRSNKEVVHEN